MPGNWGGAGPPLSTPVSVGDFISKAPGQRTVLLSFGYWVQNVDFSLGPAKQLRIRAVEGRSLPYIYRNL